MTGSLFELPAVCSVSAILWVKRCSALSGAVVIDCDQFDLKQWCRCVNARADVAAAAVFALVASQVSALRAARARDGIASMHL